MGRSGTIDKLNDLPNRPHAGKGCKNYTGTLKIKRKVKLWKLHGYTSFMGFFLFDLSSGEGIPRNPGKGKSSPKAKEETD